jgi:predicted nucleotidyltransferase
MGALENHMMDIASLCAKYKVRALYAFGSVLTEKFNDQSDIDFLVDFHPLDVFEYGDNYFELKFSLEDLFQRHIDLLEEKAIKNPFFKKSIHEHRKLIYGS